MSRNCKKFERCAAPICPMVGMIDTSAIWFPREEICSLQKYCKTNLVRNQRKIAKKARNTEGFFNQEMLSHRLIVGKLIKGICPDLPISESGKVISNWIGRHPERQMSEEQKRKLYKILEKARQYRRSNKGTSIRR